MNTDDLTNVGKACAAWGDDCPHWVIVLAQECDATSQSNVGKRLKYTTGSVCSSVISNTYKGDMAMVESRVQGELMAASVLCPASGQISLVVCLDNQQHAKAGNRTSAFRARMVKACGDCPTSRIGRSRKC